MNCSTLGLPVHHQLPRFIQTHVHWVRDAGTTPPKFRISRKDEQGRNEIAFIQIKIIVRYHLTPVKMTIIKNTANNKWWIGYGENFTLLVGMYIGKPLWRTVWRSLKRLKLEFHMILKSNYWPFNWQNYDSKRYMHPYAHGSTIHNSQDMQTSWMSTDRWMDKEAVVRYTIKCYSAIKRNKIIPFAVTWMDLEIITLNEVVTRWKTNTICYHLYVESKLWHKWIYLWNRNRLADIKTRLVVARGEEK